MKFTYETGIGGRVVNCEVDERILFNGENMITAWNSTDKSPIKIPRYTLLGILASLEQDMFKDGL